MCFLAKDGDILYMTQMVRLITYARYDDSLKSEMVQMEKEIIFEAKHMRKEFGPTIALKDVDFTLRRGEIRGLVGENGSGKSTIMSIASGMQPATSGEMFYKGQPWKPGTMVEAQDAGISMILQEANTIPGVTVAQNIFAGHEADFSSFGMINMRKMKKEAQQVLEKFGIGHIRAGDLIDRYTFEDRKLVELVRCVTDKTEILVVDETTTALSLEGREILYKLIHRMADEGKAVVFVSHDMDEILEQCTDLTVLRDGDIIGHLTREEMDAEDSVKTIRYMMVGREIGDKYYREDYDTSHQDDVAWKELFEKEGFEVTVRDRRVTIEPSDFDTPVLSPEKAALMGELYRGVEDTRKCYDLYVYVCNMQNASNNTTLRLNWNVVFGLGDDAPWLTAEVPVMMISTGYPYHLFDAPMVETFINAYSSEPQYRRAVMEKIMGRSEFRGVSPMDPYCGKDYLKY